MWKVKFHPKGCFFCMESSLVMHSHYGKLIKGDNTLVMDATGRKKKLSCAITFSFGAHLLTIYGLLLMVSWG